MDTSNVNVQLPDWYESTNGPQISMTLKFLSAEIIPVIHDLTGKVIVGATADRLIDAALVLVFGIGAVIGHIRAKKVLGAQIKKLTVDNEALGSALAAR